MSSQQPTHPVSVTGGPGGGALGALHRLGLAGRPNAGNSYALSPGVTASLTAVLAALRWGAVMIGLAWTTTWAAQGNLRIVVTLVVAIFITSWRTIAPIRFGEPGQLPILKAIGDVAALSLAVGLSDGLTSPFVGSLFVAIAVAGFGWGLSVGVLCGVLGLALAPVPPMLLGEGLQYPGPLAITALTGVATLPGLGLDRLLDLEVRRRALVDQRNRLAEANQLLGMLNELARTLPSSLDLNDVLQATRRQVTDLFEPDRLAIVAYEDGSWAPLVQEGFDIAPRVSTAELPSPLHMAADSIDVMLVDSLGSYHGRRGSGLYTRLVVNGVDIGLLAVEHQRPGRYNPSDADVLRSMADVLALTLANAQAFRRLRSLAAAEERSRIARDLHDRLGQYLTYIALELERINSARDQPSPELKELHGDVQGAISEFRDTLIELRAAVTPDRPLAVVLSEVVERFRTRSMLDVRLVLPESDERLPALVENELLRIAQEALTNVEKHSAATAVHVAWAIAGGRGMLVVQDNGRGFDPGKGIRGSAYGLVGMRERAASVGAMLEIASAPGQGTAITVQTSQPSEQVKKP